MPSTITSYTTFVANTKARAAELNNNLSNHRGTLLPIEADTAAASDLEHDLGSTEHRWKDVYCQRVIKTSLSGTTTAATSGFAISANYLQSFLTTSAQNISGSTVTVTVVGRPVQIGLVSGGTNTSYVGMAGLTSGGNIFYVSFLRDGATLCTQQVAFNNGNATDHQVPPGCFTHLDFPAAGTYNYSISARTQNTSATAANFVNVRTYAYEL